VTGDPERQAGDVAARLRGVLDAIDARELDATDVQRAHLAGAVAALEWVAGQRANPPFLRDTERLAYAEGMAARRSKRTTTGPVRALGYLRVSTEGQAESGAGLDAQRAAIEAEAQRQGWQLEVVADTGSGANLNRPAPPWPRPWIGSTGVRSICSSPRSLTGSAAV
jgi:Resolvase, N terminal domain